MNKLNNLLLVTIFLVITLPCVAYLNDYAFTSTSSPYIEITGGTQMTTNLNLHPADNQFYVDPDSLQGYYDIKTGPGFPIGFSFMMNGYCFDRLGIHLKGWISLGQSALTPSVNMDNAEALTEYPLSSDIEILPAQLFTRIASASNFVARNTSQLRVETIGTAPNRVCIVQWKDMKRFPSFCTNDHINFQIQLHETTNKVVLHYGEVILHTGWYFYSQVGMRGAAVNDFAVRETSTADWSATTPATHNAGNCGLWNSLRPQLNLKFSYTPPPNAINDLSAMQITGPQATQVNSPSTYIVTIHNRGSATQSGYNVKLMNGINELASATGPALSANESTEIPLTFTPSAVGQFQLISKVVHAGDEYSDNNSTLPLALTVMLPNTSAVTIGTGGTRNQNVPVAFSYYNGLSEVLYLASELNTTGSITAIEYYGKLRSAVGLKHTNIWVGTTMDSDLSSGWIPSGMLTQVFSGEVFYPSGQSRVIIPFTNPYTYAGGNLVVMVHHPIEADSTWFGSGEYWDCQTVDSYRTKLSYSTYQEVSHTDPVPGFMSYLTPKTTLYFTLAGNPQFAITPQTHDYGQVLMNQSDRQQFNISDTGSGTLTLNNISLSGSPYFALQNLPTLPYYLSSGQSISFTAVYTPLAVGTHAATISLTDNLSRQIHTVSLSGSSVDGTIYNFPYTQNWDASQELPFNWQILLNGQGSVSVQDSSFTSPHSAPNSAIIWNNGNQAGPFLIAPPITGTTAANTLRIKLWAKGNSILKIGVMSDPHTTASFVALDSLHLSMVWAEYEVGLQAYAGTGRYLAFKNENTNPAHVFLDDIMITELLQNDLDAITLAGDITPNVGEQTVYHVEIINRGSLPQSAYQVKLLNEANIELSSLAGPVLNPGQRTQLSFSWTPETPGATNINAQTFLTGDQQTANDVSNTLYLNVRPANSLELVVGSGNESARIPLDVYRTSSLHQYLIYPAEINNTSGLITGLGLYSQFTQAIAFATKLWIGTTNLGDLSDSWLSVGSHSLVFDGTLSIPTGNYYLEILFQQPFTYLSGGNLVLTFERTMDNVNYNQNNLFLAQTEALPRARNVSSNFVDYDPLTPPMPSEGTLSGQFAKTALILISGEGGTLSGTVTGANSQPLSGVSVQFTAGAYHTSTNAQGEYLIPAIWPGNYQVSYNLVGYSPQTPNIIIQGGQTTLMNINLQPLPVVAVSGTILASDTGSGLAGATVVLGGYADYNTTTNTVGAFTIPGVYANNSYSYQISAPGYHPTSGQIQLGSSNYSMGTITLAEHALPPLEATAQEAISGSLVSISWLPPNPVINQTASFVKPHSRYIFSGNRSLTGYKVWRLDEGQENDENSWIPLTPNQINTLTLDDPGWQMIPNGNYRWAVKAYYTGENISDPVLTNVLCKNVETGYLNGIVRRLNNTPIQGATVSTGNYLALTNSAGSYTLVLPVGIYNITCAADGFVTQTVPELGILAQQVTTQNFTLSPVLASDDLIPISETLLIGNHPNPFNPETTISYAIKDACDVHLEIYNLKGQKVRTLVNSRQDTGNYRVVFNSRDDSGQALASGIYLYRLTAGSYTSTRKMMLME